MSSSNANKCFRLLRDQLILIFYFSILTDFILYFEIFINKFFVFFAVQQKPSKQPHGMKLNMLTQNGFIYSRVRDIADRIFWKCALSSSHKCSAVFATNKFLRVLDNQRNIHNHAKSAYDSFKKNINVSKPKLR